jgi:hypothetical protein
MGLGIYWEIMCGQSIPSFISFSPLYLGILFTLSPFGAISVSSFSLIIHKKKYKPIIYILMVVCCLMLF